MGEASDLLVFLVVLGLRLFVPLLIPKFPLPAIITALVLDGIDQTIFQRYTDLDLTNYQSYDKALDIYYLTIAYLSTFRNWENLAAFRMSQFLYFFRLAGVTLFEFTQARAMLLLFPNTFEYFFIFYEAVRLRWNPVRMGAALVIGAAGAIWVFIKVPQEYWIHIAQLDVTDELAANPGMIPVLIGAVVALLIVGWWLLTKRLPPADRKLTFVVDDPFGHEAYRQAELAVRARPLLNLALAEKTVMVSLVSVIFSQILPEVTASPLQLSIGIAVLIVANTLVSEWLARRGIGDWRTAGREFGAMVVVNAGLVIAAWLILPVGDGSLHVGNTLFFLLMVTLLVTLYDRYQPWFLIREAEVAVPPAA